VPQIWHIFSNIRLIFECVYLHRISTFLKCDQLITTSCSFGKKLTIILCEANNESKKQKQYYDFMIRQIIIEMNATVHSEELTEKNFGCVVQFAPNALRTWVSNTVKFFLQCFRRHFITQYKNLDCVVFSKRFGTSCLLLLIPTRRITNTGESKKHP
jgi:hypothetical protein